MLNTRFRFHGHSGLKYLYAQGRTVRGRSMAIRYVANPKRSDSRVAVIVTKKTLKSAPKRNRLRRRIYEVLRTNWQYIPGGYDILVTAYEAQLLTLDHKELVKLIIDLLIQARVWHETKEDSLKIH